MKVKVVFIANGSWETETEDLEQFYSNAHEELKRITKGAIKGFNINFDDIEFEAK